MITIKDLQEKGYKEFSNEPYGYGSKVLFQKRVRDEETGITQYFINAWVFFHKDGEINIEFELVTETINSYWSRYYIYSIPDFITLEDIEKGMYQHWLVDGALYGE